MLLTRRLMTVWRDSRGRMTSLDDKEVATGTTRTTTYQYQDADGVYVTTTTNPMGHLTRVWRHPGFGFVVETDDSEQPGFGIELRHVRASSFADRRGRRS